ncbi:MAG: HAD-IC family P-type ATPase [Clostridia bacterium]
MQSKYDGLTTEEAARLKGEGKANEMPKARDGGVAEILRRNVLTLFNLLNVALAAVLFVVGSYRNMLFMGVILSNALIGTIQELRAKHTHDKLLLLSEGQTKALRDGREVLLSPRELVLGDVVRLNRGDQIPADATVLQGEALVDESLLTGESKAVRKHEGDTLFSGSFLTSGSVTAVLTAVGAESYAGKLQMSARRVHRPTSALMQDMNRIIKVVSIAIVPIGGLLFLKQHYALELPFAVAATRTVASVLGMIPEGLILLTSMALAVGVVKLGRKKALVNELYGIESLARTDVVCMDKTGTLTNGEMSVSQTLPLAGAEAAEIARCLSALLTTFTELTPTNKALREAFPTTETWTPTMVVPFSSERKWSAARFEGLGTVVLGAPERTLVDVEEAQSYAAQGLRVLALLKGEDVAFGGTADAPTLPQGLRPMALICLRDTLRPQVCETIRYFGEQGVALKVISGDSPLTVSHVALDAGVPDAERLIDLSTLEAPIDYCTLSREYTVFGRVSPEDKCHLIAAYKADGHSVAMVGDGVNDIPALKAADCSIAMAGGSDAACRVSQITLLNADFEAMPSIVLEGRRVINNITRASSLFLVKNIFSLLVSVLLLALPFAYPFSPIQLTLVSTLTIGFPAFVLALQPSNERVRGKFLQNVIIRALPGGCCVGILILVVMCFAPRLGFSEQVVSTLCTILAGYAGIWVLLLTCLPLNAMRTALVLLVAVGFTAAISFFPGTFYLVHPTGSQWWVLGILLALVPAVIIGLGEVVRRLTRRWEHENAPTNTLAE